MGFFGGDAEASARGEVSARLKDPPLPPSMDIDLSGLFLGDRRPAPASGQDEKETVKVPHDLFTRYSARTEERRARAKAAPVPRDPSASRGERGLLARGTVLDKYRIDGVLGTGGFAVVYRATHELLQVPVAIKLLRPRVLSREPNVARLLLEEARYAARISHPNVVRVHDVTHTEAITYIVMEYIEGRSLSATLERTGPLAPAEALSVAIDVAEGLKAGLQVGLIHRDIKPANILLPRGGARIVDFGLALAGSAFGRSEATTSQVVGTRGYMAPEQARTPSRVDFRADVYSLGVTLCQALTGASPHARRSDGDLLRDVPRKLEPLLRKMLASTPEGRPSSYDALLTMLRLAARHL